MLLMRRWRAGTGTWNRGGAESGRLSEMRWKVGESGFLHPDFGIVYLLLKRSDFEPIEYRSGNYDNHV